jgi:hypothetical protein
MVNLRLNKKFTRSIATAIVQTVKRSRITLKVVFFTATLLSIGQSIEVSLEIMEVGSAVTRYLEAPTVTHEVDTVMELRYRR